MTRILVKKKMILVKKQHKVVIENEGEKKMENNESKMKKTYSFYALSVAIFGVAVTLLQLGGSYGIAPLIGVNPDESGWFPFVNIIIPMYLICFPILLLVLGKSEVVKPEKNKLSFGKFLLYIPLMAAMIAVGAVIGIILNMLCTLPFGVSMEYSTEISKIMMNSHPFWRILTAGILAPIVEEMIFRKLLIDRTYRYGEWVAIFTSGIMFGLFHGNFAQCFFAALIGGLFAYIYCRTGNVVYTIILHAILNLSTSVISMATMKPYMSVDRALLDEYHNLSVAFLSSQDPATAERVTELGMQIIPKMFPFMAWSGLVGTVMFAGFILWIVILVRKNVVIKKAPDQVQGGMKYAWGNIGMILFLVYTLATFAINYIAIIVKYGSVV